MALVFELEFSSMGINSRGGELSGSSCNATFEGSFFYFCLYDLVVAPCFPFDLFGLYTEELLLIFDLASETELACLCID
jgi:hypothetical protein